MPPASVAPKCENSVSHNFSRTIAPNRAGSALPLTSIISSDGGRTAPAGIAASTCCKEIGAIDSAFTLCRRMAVTASLGFVSTSVPPVLKVRSIRVQPQVIPMPIAQICTAGTRPTASQLSVTRAAIRSWLMAEKFGVPVVPEDAKIRNTAEPSGQGDDRRRIRVRRRHAGQNSLDRQAPYARFRRPATFDDADIHSFGGQRQVGRRHAQARQRQRDDQTGKFVRARDRQADRLPGNDAMGGERSRRRIDHPVERPVRHAGMIGPDNGDRGGVEACRSADGFGNVHANATLLSFPG